MSFKNLVVLTLFVIGSVSGPARAGNEGSGGGFSGPNGDLFDFYENEGSITFDPLSVPGVRSTLEGIQARVPRLYTVLHKSLSKSWYFESKPLKECPGGESLILSDKGTVACQTKIEVRISKSWYDDVSLGEEKTARKRKGIILHELARGVRITAITAGRTAPDEDMLRAMTRTISLAQLPTEQELRDLALEYNFGNFKTASEILTRNNFVGGQIACVTKLYADLTALITQKS
ncbi:MAG: hypothetical protein AAB116_00720 [Candidatus Poribacteria bacterium]